MARTRKKRVVPKTSTSSQRSKPDITIRQTLRLHHPWPSAWDEAPPDWESATRFDFQFRGPRMSFIHLLLKSDEDLGKFFHTHLFNHTRYEQALLPQPRGRKPNRAFNYALQSLYEWAKTQDKESRREGLYANICGSTDRYDIHYPAELACFVARELFKDDPEVDPKKMKGLLTRASGKESQTKRCRDFIRRHPCHSREDQLPQFISHGQALVNVFLYRMKKASEP